MNARGRDRQRLAEAPASSPRLVTRDKFDIALTETSNGLYKTEGIHQ